MDNQLTVYYSRESVEEILEDFPLALDLAKEWFKTVRDNDVVEVYCRDHGKFYVQAGEHLAGKGCPICDFLNN